MEGCVDECHGETRDCAVFALYHIISSPLQQGDGVHLVPAGLCYLCCTALMGQWNGDDHVVVVYWMKRDEC